MLVGVEELRAADGSVREPMLMGAHGGDGESRGRDARRCSTVRVGGGAQWSTVREMAVVDSEERGLLEM